MNPADTYQAIGALVGALSRFGGPFEAALVALAVLLAAFALLPRLARFRTFVLRGAALILLGGEAVLVWFHVRLASLSAVVDPATGQVTGHVAVPLWVESEKLYVWALVVLVFGALMRRQRAELESGVLLIAAALVAGAALLGKPFTAPLPSFLGQYAGYLGAMASGGMAARGAFEGLEAARQFYYDAWYMWVHPPLLFLGYGAFVISFVATVRMIVARRASFESTAYRWMALGYLPLTLGMLLGFPWAIMSWQGESWWWSGKVNMSIMMWLLYTGVLHARLYLRRRNMWKAVAVIAVLSFIVLVLTYITTYVVPGAHSYAAAA